MEQKIINKILKIKSKYQNLLFVFIIIMEIIIGMLFYVYYYNEDTLKEEISVRSISLNSNKGDIVNDIKNIEYIESVYEKWEEIYLKDIGNINYYDLGIVLKINEVLVNDLSSYNIGDKIFFKYNDENYELVVIGYYDSKFGIKDLIVGYETIEKFSRKIKNSYQVIVNDYDNLKYVFNKLQDMGFDVNIINTKEVEMLEKNQMIIHLMIIFVIVINILVFGVLMLVIKDIMFENKKNFAIMKVVGYKNKHIINYTIKSIWNLMLKAFVKASVLIGGIAIIVWREVVIFKILTITYLVIFILLLVTVLINRLYIYMKIKKVYPIILYKE